MKRETSVHTNISLIILIQYNTDTYCAKIETYATDSLQIILQVIFLTL